MNQCSSKTPQITGRDIMEQGYPQGPLVGLALKCSNAAIKAGMLRDTALGVAKVIYEKPDHHIDNPYFGDLARKLVSQRFVPDVPKYEFKDKPLTIFGQEMIDENTIEQMKTAARIPVAVRGVICADGHLGYGLPIGGVLACRNAVIPFGVGVDIGCRMRLSILPIKSLEDKWKKQETFEDGFVKAIDKHTLFGAGQDWTRSGRRNHPVMDEDWSIPEKVKQGLKDIAWKQLGSSGSGNHFCDVGEIVFEQELKVGEKIVSPGTYLAIMTHSGSRGAGATIASYYSKMAEKIHKYLPAEYKKLAWLDMNAEGAEYWDAMNLMLRYAAANHEVIHHSIMKFLGIEPIAEIENHHNFAQKEMVNGEELIVHRKGATPAGLGVLGIIPGSMATPAYLVSGKGNEASLCSASHGAGRLMSRTKTKEKYQGQWSSIQDMLKHKRVRLLSAGLDEVPGAYKNLEEVMARQVDLVDIKAVFHPRIVKMSDDGTNED